MDNLSGNINLGVVLCCAFVVGSWWLLFLAFAATWGAPVGDITKSIPMTFMPFVYLRHKPSKHDTLPDIWYQQQVAKMTLDELLFVREHISKKYVVRYNTIILALKAHGINEELLVADEKEMQTALVPTTCSSIFLAHFINWFLFFAICGIIGGDALNGKVTDGVYYVVWHGKYTAVPEPIFRFSHVHTAYSLMMLIPSFACLVIVGTDKKFKSFFTLKYNYWQKMIIFVIPAFWLLIFIVVWSLTGFHLSSYWKGI